MISRFPKYSKRRTPAFTGRKLEGRDMEEEDKKEQTSEELCSFITELV